MTINFVETPISRFFSSFFLLFFTDSHLQLRFRSDDKKRDLEALFLTVDESSKFIYLKSFRRARVDFSSSGKAAAARNKCDGISFEGEKIRCYFAQVCSVLVESGNAGWMVSLSSSMLLNQQKKRKKQASINNGNSRADNTEAVLQMN